MHPKTLNALQNCYHRGLTESDWPVRSLTSAKHFHISAGIAGAAETIAEHEVLQTTDDDPLVFPEGSRLPAKYVVLTEEHKNMPPMLLIQDGSGVSVSICLETAIVPMFAYCPGQTEGRLKLINQYRNGTVGRKFRESIPDKTLQICSVRAAFIISLINEPRRVTITEAHGLNFSRQYRKTVHRLTGKAAFAYSLVSWQVGGSVNAKSTDGDGTFRKPLHWCRGHMRSAKKGWENAFWHDSKIGGESGWKIWIRDCWKGHPDYGLKLQSHAPRMLGEKRTVPRGAIPAVPSAFKLAAMSAQQRQLMVEAGHAPSSILH